MLHNFVRHLHGADDPHFNVFHTRELSSQSPSLSTRSNNSFTNTAKYIRTDFKIILNATQLTSTNEILIVYVYKI
jgi:hypothetical protein